MLPAPPILPRENTLRDNARDNYYDSDIFGLLVENVKDYAIFVTDADGHIISWNKGAENIKGYIADEVIGRHIRIFYCQDDIDNNIPQHNLQEAILNGRYEDEGWRLRKDGSQFWANVVFTTLYNNDGSVKGFAKITRDITQRKQYEDKLAGLATVIENTANAIFSTGLSLNILTWNKSAENLYGYTVEEALGATTIQLLKPQISSEFLAARNKIIAEKKYWNGDIAHIHKNGRLIVVLASISPTFNKQGNIDGYVFIVRDKTEQKKAEEKIAYLAKLIDITSDAIYSYNADYGVLSWNKAAENIYGYTAAEVVHKNVIDIVKPVMPDEVRQELRKQVAERNFWSGEVTHTRKDGTAIAVHISISVRRNAENEVEEYVCICRDITERKKEEENARRMQAEIKELTQLKLDTSLKEVSDYKYALDKSSIVAITDQKGLIQFANDNFCAISGYPRDELIGKDHRIINSGHHRTEFIRNLWVTIANGGVWKGELKNRAKNGTYYWVDTTIIPFLDNKGKPYQYVAIRADITEKKKAEADLYSLNEQLEGRVEKRTRELEKANKELESFSYSVSHDLRGPLRSISGFSRILEEDYGHLMDDEGRRLLNKIINGAGNMGRLIDDLLAFTRLGKLDTEAGGVNMHALVRNCIDELEQNMGLAAYTINIAQLPNCVGDINMFKQVWLNLIGNALKYSAKNPQPVVTISGREEGEMNIYAVQDNGVGFDMQYYAKLFGVFQRLHGNDEFEGTGVGLALVKLIVNKHGGEIWAEALPGKGATFYFSLPKE